MGRLFWKLFFLFWLTMITSAVAVASVFWLRWGELPLPSASRIDPESVESAAVPAGDSVSTTRPPHRPHPAPPLLAMLLSSIVLCAILARNLSKPIRSLHWAFDAIAHGRLETRVLPRLGRRTDEIAGLFRGFDRMAEQLQILVSSQRRLLHDVSHELRSPLARLHAAIGLVRQDPAKLESTLDRVEREAERLESLVGELLTLAQLETPRGEDPLESVDVIDLVASIAADARFEAHTLDRDVSFSGVGEAVALVQAEVLHRAFENVIRNAVKYTAEETVVEVDLRRFAQRIRVTVADRGPGVPEGDLEAIFEPFYRASNVGPHQGAGLGLAITRRAIDVHGGTIRARPRAGGGLIVEIELPLEPDVRRDSRSETDLIGPHES